MAENRPQGRKTNVTGQSTGAYRRGDGLNTGPVGKSGSNPFNSNQSSPKPGMSRAAKAGGGGGLLLVFLLLFFLLRGCGGSGSCSDLRRPAGGGTGSSGQQLPGSSSARTDLRSFFRQQLSGRTGRSVPGRHHHRGGSQPLCQPPGQHELLRHRR